MCDRVSGCVKEITIPGQFLFLMFGRGCYEVKKEVKSGMVNVRKS